MGETEVSRAALKRRRFFYKLWNGAKERLMFQCVICGLALAALMGANLIKGGIGEWIKQHASSAVTQNADWYSYGQTIANIINPSGTSAAKGIERDEAPQPETIGKPDSIKPNSSLPPLKIEIEGDPSDAVIVDEAVLSDILNADDPYMEQFNAAE